MILYTLWMVCQHSLFLPKKTLLDSERLEDAALLSIHGVWSQTKSPPDLRWESEVPRRSISAEETCEATSNTTLAGRELRFRTAAQ